MFLSIYRFLVWHPNFNQTIHHLLAKTALGMCPGYVNALGKKKTNLLYINQETHITFIIIAIVIIVIIIVIVPLIVLNVK